VGQTKSKVETLMRAAQGGVLFIDEAYALGNRGYGEEAMTKLLSMLTEEPYRDGKTVVILAGYCDQMHLMLQRNPGLKSRFAQVIEFPDWDAQKCTDFVLHKLLHEVFPVPYTLVESKDALTESLYRAFSVLRLRPGWANVRDVLNAIDLIESARDERVDAGGLMTGGDRVLLLRDCHLAMERFILQRPAVNAGESFPVEDFPLEQVQTHDHLDIAPGMLQSTQARDPERAAAESPEVVTTDYFGMAMDDLTVINPALEELFTGEKMEQMLNRLAVRGEEFDSLRDRLVIQGLEPAEAVRIIESYIEARNNSTKERLRREAKRRELEREKQISRKPIVQCQVCGRTANYWAPCWVAPKEIGYEENEVDVLF